MDDTAVVVEPETSESETSEPSKPEPVRMEIADFPPEIRQVLFSLWLVDRKIVKLDPNGPVVWVEGKTRCVAVPNCPQELFSHLRVGETVGEGVTRMAALKAVLTPPVSAAEIWH